MGYLAFLTRMTGPRLFFESTRDFLQSAIRTVIPLLQKIPGESKALRDDVHGRTRLVGRSREPPSRPLVRNAGQEVNFGQERTPS